MRNDTTPNRMRMLARRAADAITLTETKQEPTMRDMLKITRNLREQQEEQQEPKVRTNKKNQFDQTREEDRFRNFFNDMNINVKFQELEVYDDLIFFGGTIDGMIQFIYKVTPDESTSGVQFNYLNGFTIDNPENQELIDKIESYYDSFYKYWRDNVLEQD